MSLCPTRGRPCRFPFRLQFILKGCTKVEMPPNLLALAATPAPVQA
jgi:hypothetical protein